MVKMEPEKFINWIGSHAVNACKKWNLPASVQIAQAILESGWGATCIGKYNLFGIKYFGVGEPIYMNGVAWADFNSVKEACEVQAKTIGRPGGYYINAVNLLPDIKAYVEAMAGIYAPASEGNYNYADKIINICNSWNLWEWDDPELRYWK